MLVLHPRSEIAIENEFPVRTQISSAVRRRCVDSAQWKTTSLRIEAHLLTAERAGQRHEYYDQMNCKQETRRSCSRNTPNGGGCMHSSTVEPDRRRAATAANGTWRAGPRSVVVERSRTERAHARADLLLDAPEQRWVAYQR